MKLSRAINLILATVAGMGLRIAFIHWFPFSSGDSDLYQELAHNLLDSGAYGVYAGGSLTPAALRMPGYPLFLVAVEWLIGPGDERLCVVQAGIDVVACLLVAWLAAKLNPRTFCIALWMAALCPFTANYTATPLTETLTIALTAAALLAFSDERIFTGSLLLGLATMMRPESPLLFPAVGLALVWKYRYEFQRSLRVLTRHALVMAAGLLLFLLPFGYRNWTETGAFTMIANPAAALPWEPMPIGFDAWCRTWLVSVDETYQFPFKYEEEAMNPADLPPRAYDSPAERARTVALIERLNRVKTATPDVEYDFRQLARERAARNPLRQYLTVPAFPAVHFSFTPPPQTLPCSGEPVTPFHSRVPKGF